MFERILLPLDGSEIAVFFGKSLIRDHGGELARSKGSSLAVAMCEMLGIEPREFKRELHEAANLLR